MKLKSSLMVAISLLFAQQAHAQSLLEAFTKALAHDPSYKAAQAAKKAGEAEQRIGRAGLLPQVSAVLYEGRSENERSLLNTPNPRPETTDFDVKNNSLTLQQPIINMEGHARYAQGELIAKQAEAQEAEALGQLSLRVTTAYLDILSAVDQLRLAESETASLKERLALVQSGMRAGEASRTDLAESQAQLDLANARLLEAKESLSLRLRTLENTTGVKSNAVLFPSDLNVAAVTPPPSFDKLKSRMLLNSPSVIASLYDIRIAEKEVAKQNAGHMPRLDFIARLSESESDTVNTIGQRNDQTTYALQMQIPIFAGFGVSAAVDKALANLERATVSWRAKVQDNGYKLQEEYSKYSISKVKIDAFKKAVESGQESLKAAELGQKLGVRTLSDVLEAQRLLFNTQKDYSRVRYETLAALVNLNSISGQLNIRTITEISELLAAKAEVVEFQRPDLINLQMEDPNQFELLDFNAPVIESRRSDQTLKKVLLENNQVVFSLQDDPALVAPPKMAE